MTQPFKLATPRSHHPFRLRKIIVFSSLALGVFGVSLLGNPAGRFFPFDYPWEHNGLLGLAIYFCSVTFLDFWIHNYLGKKASDDSNPELLLVSERVNEKELDLYFETRKWIRLSSLVLAGLAFLLLNHISPYGLEAFCSVYILSTLAGIFSARQFGKIRRPRLIYRDDSCYKGPPRKPFAALDFANWYSGGGPLP